MARANDKGNKPGGGDQSGPAACDSCDRAAAAADLLPKDDQAEAAGKPAYDADERTNRCTYESAEKQTKNKTREDPQSGTDKRAGCRSHGSPVAD